jgi:hypothetical protein
LENNVYESCKRTKSLENGKGNYMNKDDIAQLGYNSFLFALKLYIKKFFRARSKRVENAFNFAIKHLEKREDSYITQLKQSEKH